MKTNTRSSSSSSLSSVDVFIALVGILIVSIFAIAIFNTSETVFAQIQNDGSSSNNNTTDNVSKTLGSPIMESNGMITGQRVLEVYPIPKMEVSFFQNSTLKGNISASEMGTYESVMKKDGSVYGKGQGMIFTQNGEMAIYTAQGIGHTAPNGNMVFLGSLFFDTNSTTGQLSFLKNMVGMFEYEVDHRDGKTTAKVWEWK